METPNFGLDILICIYLAVYIIVLLIKVVKHFYIRPISMETPNFGLDIPTMVSPLNVVIHPERAKQSHPPCFDNCHNTNVF